VCSYCGCCALASIAQLTAEHEQIVNLMGDVRRAMGATDATLLETATSRLTAALTRHTDGEERSLFTELRDDPELAGHVDALCAEHVDLDSRLGRLQPGGTAAVHDLEGLLRRHIDKEENGLFPAAAISLDGAAWDRVDARLADDAVPHVAVAENEPAVLALVREHPPTSSE
jgi:hemerythrin-like domain-containing protein